MNFKQQSLDLHLMSRRQLPALNKIKTVRGRLSRKIRFITPFTGAINAHLPKSYFLSTKQSPIQEIVSWTGLKVWRNRELFEHDHALNDRSPVTFQTIKVDAGSNIGSGFIDAVPSDGMLTGRKGTGLQKFDSPSQ